MGKGRAPCCDKSKVKKGPWSPAEDLRLTAFIHNSGHGNWRSLPQRAGLLRCGKSCRLRWINYLRPDVKRGPLTHEEELQIINLHSSMGNKWSKIASHLPGRTDNEIKNVWNTHLKKKMLKTDQQNLANSPSSSSSHSCISNVGINMENEEPLEMIINDIPLEYDIVDLWEILDTPNNNVFDDSVPTESNVVASQLPPPISQGSCQEKEDENLDFNKWLMYLENELELVGTPNEGGEKDSTQNEMMTHNDKTNHDENDLNYFSMLSSSPNDLTI